MTFSPTWRLMRLSVMSLLLSSSFVTAQGQSAAATTSASFSDSSSVAAASSTTRTPITHTVDVAQGGFTFTPDVTLAEVGDYVQYNFFPTNHSVVRAEWKYPCIPYEDTGVDKIGFFSGFQPVDEILPNPPTFTIRINDTNPIFYYCSAPGSCINYAMVGVINPNATTPLAIQQAYARNSTFMLQPGEAWPSESTPDPFSSSSAAPTSTSTTMATSASSTSSSTAAATSSAAAAPHHAALSPGGIAGVAIGAAAVAILAAALLYMCGRHSRRPHQPVPQYDPHMSYMSAMPNASKHGTIVSGREASPYGAEPFASAALPGYVPPQDAGAASPARPYFAPSDALTPASEREGRSPSPTQMMRGVGVPPYSSLAQSQQPSRDSQPSQSGGVVHEMDAPGGQSGFNPNRSSSIRKSSGVERYS